MDTRTETLPHWEMRTIFPSLESAEFTHAFNGVGAGIDAIVALGARHGVGRRPTPTVDAATVAAAEEVIAAINRLHDQHETVEAYLYAFTTTEATNALAQARASELRTRMIAWYQFEARLNAWYGSLDLDELCRRSPLARAHEYALRRAAIVARHQMSVAEEDLAAALGPSAGAAWAKLHDDITARLSVPVTLGGEVQHLPMSAVRNLAYDADPAVRRSAYQAELVAWPTVEIPLAAALNGIKGEVGTLNGRRGWADSVAPSLLASAIDATALAAMQQAVVEALPDFRRYLRAKARLLGGARLAWWDLFAPVGRLGRQWRYAEAADFIIDQFAAHGPRLAGLARRAFDEGWIDAEPRVGKVGGAYCMSIRPGESRVLTNYDGSFSAVGTLAHELGHAYHNLCLAERTALQRFLPMTLAETASIFCETLIEEAELRRATGDERLAMLEYSLQNATQVVVDIHSRFLFEQSVFQQRLARELAAEEFSAAMLAAQRQTYGDGLDEATLHPYMWAVKGHYYSPDLSYYNYPYTFGHLFGMGLYALRQRPGFGDDYDALLAASGLDEAAPLAHRFGIDIQQPDFWRGSLAVIRQRIDQFEALVDAQG